MFDTLTRDIARDVADKIDETIGAVRGYVNGTAYAFLAAVAAAETVDAYIAAIDGLNAALRPQTTRYRVAGDDERLAEAEEIERDLRFINVTAIIGHLRSEAESRRRPDGYLNPERPEYRSSWAVAELLLDRVGEPVLFSEMNETYAAASRSSRDRLSGAHASSIVVDVANRNLGRLAPRKTKVGSKAAYILI